MQIKAANHARDQLRRQAKKTGVKSRYFHIQDDRLVKQPSNAYSLFLKDRFDSGDMKGMALAEISKLIAREWKGLNTSEKKVSQATTFSRTNRTNQKTAIPRQVSS